MDAVLGGMLLQMAGGTAALFFGRCPRVATLLGAGAAALGCLLGLAQAWRVLLGGAAQGLRLNWDAAHGAFSIGIDPLSAFFLLPVLGLSALAAVYGGEYLLAYRQEKSLGSP